MPVIPPLVYPVDKVQAHQVTDQETENSLIVGERHVQPSDDRHGKGLR